MPRRAREKSKSSIYHIMWRGANRQEIFHDDGDRKKYMQVLEKYKLKSQMNIFAWCLMGNHVHILLKEGQEELSTTMKRIGVSYAMYYNWKYRTTGHLFQDRFRSENVETDTYLRTVIRYIHQNPVKAGIVSKVDQWNWSSCRGYYNQAPEQSRLLDKDLVLRMFSFDRKEALERFKEFNEKQNNDSCLDDYEVTKRLSDDEARMEINRILKGIEIPHVKSLTKQERDDILKKIKGIEGISQRQLARILGISANLIFKAGKGKHGDGSTASKLSE